MLYKEQKTLLYKVTLISKTLNLAGTKAKPLKLMLVLLICTKRDHTHTSIQTLFIF